MNRPVLYVCVNNHFDPTWRRCWDERFTHAGNEFVSYADIEEYYFLDNLALARRFPDYAFAAESAVVARKFLARHPECLDELRDLARRGRFAVSGAGDNIVDANMVLGESLVRNFLYGLLWVEATFGRPTRLAVRNDAFGNSAQVPQILRGCGIRWCTGLSYSRAEGRYWRGLDGSTVLHATIPTVAHGGGWDKYPPCAACRGAGWDEAAGAGCAACAGRGIDPTRRSRAPAAVDMRELSELGAGLAMVTPEELLPDPALVDWVRGLAATVDARFGLQEDALPHVREWLERVDNPPADQVHPSAEVNPNNSGCWVTRIRTKQVCRRQEHALLAAENLSVLAHLAMGMALPAAAVREAWQDLLFTMFHDAVTATHVDPAYRELQRIWTRVDLRTAAIRGAALDGLVRPVAGDVSVINPHGAPAGGLARARVPSGMPCAELTDGDGRRATVVAAESRPDGSTDVEFVCAPLPALSARVYRTRAAATGRGMRREENPAAATIESDRFRIEADEHGIVRILDRRLDRPLACAAEYRPGEAILEHDEGSPWATLTSNQERTPLSAETRLAAVERGEGWARLVLENSGPHRAGFVLEGVSFRTTVTVADGLDHVEFRMRVRWDTFNCRMRVAIPVPIRGRHVYGIPYGAIERRPYEPQFGWAAASGDWPAVEWGGIEAADFSVAVFDRGTPSYRMEPGRDGDVILLSLLRSPTIPTYLHEPTNVVMTDWAGMRDAGRHDFAFALTAYRGPFAGSTVVADAAAFSGGLLAVAGRAELPRPPLVKSDCVRLACLKAAEDGRGVILRLCEFRGRGGAASIYVPRTWQQAWRVDLLEREPSELPLRDGAVTLTLRPWEIASIRLV